MKRPQLLPYMDKFPKVHSTAWIAPSALIIGDTEIGSESSAWFNVVVRGDVNTIRIGNKVNLQDGAICHVTIAKAPLKIFDLVSVAHAAVVHGCTLEEGCLVGIAAKVLDLAVIGSESLIAAGSVVLEGTKVPEGELWAGVPAKKRRDLTSVERQSLRDTAERYVIYRLHYMGQTPEAIPAHLLPSI